MRNVFKAAAIVALVATTAVGQTAPLTGKTAKKILFSPRGTEFTIVQQDFMTQADVDTLNLMSGMKEFKSVFYYGAIAASPSDGLANKTTVATADHHSIEAAGNAAMAECNNLRSGGAKCVVVAHIAPKKYVPRELQLSASASAAFKKIYLKGRGAKAMATSPSTGVFAISKGDGAAEAAMATCAAKAAEKGGSDCQIVIQDQ